MYIIHLAKHTKIALYQPINCLSNDSQTSNVVYCCTLWDPCTSENTINIFILEQVWRTATCYSGHKSLNDSWMLDFQWQIFQYRSILVHNCYALQTLYVYLKNPSKREIKNKASNSHINNTIAIPTKERLT